MGTSKCHLSQQAALGQLGLASVTQQLILVGGGVGTAAGVGFGVGGQMIPTGGFDTTIPLQP